MLALFILTISLSLFTPKGEEEYLFKQVPDVRFTSEDGKTIHISDVYNNAPVILSLVYSRCTGICYPYISDLKDKLNSIRDINTNFNVLVLSFDPEDNFMDMEKMSEKEGLNKNFKWIFGTINKNQIDSFSTAVGFTFSKLGDQYDHNALLVAINQKGKIIKRLEGFQNINQIKLMMREMNGDFIPISLTSQKKSWASCFNYDPETGKMKFDWGFLIIILPVLLTLLLLITIRLYTMKHLRYGK